MKVKIRRSTQDDLENVYNLHTKCFSNADHWYRAAIRNYLDNGIVIENKTNNTLIGVLLQGNITPYNEKLDVNSSEKDDYKEDIFEPTNEYGKTFYENKMHYKEMMGIMMICIDPSFRGKGLGKKMIEKHFKDHMNKDLCLNTRRSNINAYSLYKKMGYEQIAFIKNKYFQPNEDSIFMVRAKK